jgi:hypothetical protein
LADHNPTENLLNRKTFFEPKKPLDGSFDLFENVRSIFACQRKLSETDFQGIAGRKVLLKGREEMPHARNR